MGKREGKEGGKGNLGKKKSRESCEFSKVGAYDRVQYKQCWRKLEWGLQLQQLALNFLATFFVVVTLLNNDGLLVVTVHEVHLYGLFT